MNSRNYGLIYFATLWSYEWEKFCVGLIIINIIIINIIQVEPVCLMFACVNCIIKKV